MTGWYEYIVAPSDPADDRGPFCTVAQDTKHALIKATRKSGPFAGYAWSALRVASVGSYNPNRERDS